jgi:hypothetical protein
VTAHVPIANAAGAVTGFGISAILVLIAAGIARLLIKRNRSRSPDRPAGVEDSGAGPAVEVEPNVGAMGLALAAAALAVVSVFLPALESTTFSHIAKNTLIQNGEGWLIVGCAIGIIGAVYRVYSRRTTTWAVFVLGLVVLGCAVYDGTGSRTELESVGSNPFLHESVTVTGSPAVGIYAAGAAGLMAMFAGLVLAGHVLDSYRGAERRTKTCPDCAEAVLEAARVCKHCGHEFAAEVAAPVAK